MAKDIEAMEVAQVEEITVLVYLALPSEKTPRQSGEVSKRSTLEGIKGVAGECRQDRLYLLEIVGWILATDEMLEQAEELV